MQMQKKKKQILGNDLTKKETLGLRWKNKEKQG